MEMTIDEIIKEMEEEYVAFLAGTGLNDPLRMERERKNNPDCDRVCTANEMTLNILRKYQKIQEEYKKYLNNMVTNIYADEKFIKALTEVLEDGKID